MGNVVDKEPVIKRRWCFLESSRIRLFLSEDEDSRFYFSRNDSPLEEIIAVDKKTDTCCVIISYQVESKIFGKHTLIKKKDGGLIWEYPVFDSDIIEYAFYFIDKLLLNQDIGSWTEEEKIQKLVCFMTG